MWSCFADEEPHKVVVALGGRREDEPLAADFETFYLATGRHTPWRWRLTGNWADAEDLVQEAYAAAYRDWARVGAYDDPSAWVARVVTSRAASRHRRAT